MLGVVDNVNGISMIDDGDMVVTEHRRTGAYQPRTFDRWQATVIGGGVVADIGCYTGIYSIAAAMAGCEAHAYDVNPFALSRAVANAERNKVIIHPENMAIYRNIDSIKYRKANDRPLCSTIQLVKDGTSHGTVPSKTLDANNLNNVIAIRIAKMGLSVRVLIGCMKTIRESQPEIFMAAHTPDENKKIRHYLDEMDYEMVQLDKDTVVWTTGE